MLNDLVFTKRVEKNDEVRVGFYVEPDVYEKFKTKVIQEGLILKDVFRDFMIWFGQTAGKPEDRGKDEN